MAQRLMLLHNIRRCQLRWCSSFKTTTIVEKPLRRNQPATVYSFNQHSKEWKQTKCIKELAPRSVESGLRHFLPTKYPDSVAEGYDKFAAYSFVSSVAASAAMVLSTQTLLLAVGVVGNQTEASVLAGAWNWVLKDGIGQLGGVWFASHMSRVSSQLDADPKQWRVVASLSLDIATLMELLSPLLVTNSVSVVAVASLANVLKNIGFLTASASRAALHQALAIDGNLADVTAKAGSQSILASLVGTGLGIGLSPLLQDVPHFIMGFVVLSVAHQTCNHQSLRYVPLTHLSLHRLNLVLENYIENNTVLTPEQVAAREKYIPGFPQDDTHHWLVVGSGVMELGGPEVIVDHLKDNSTFVALKNDTKVHLSFVEGASSDDLWKGLWEAHVLHRGQHGGRVTKGNLDKLVRDAKNVGWQIESVSIEPSNAVRLAVEQG